MNLKSNFRLLGILAFLAVTTLLASCKKDEPTPTFNDQGNIGAEGGIVKTSDGASVKIPAGALITNQTISITNTTEGDTIENSGCWIYEFKPDGLTFSDSIIVSLPFDDTYIDLNSNEKNYGIAIMVFQDNEWKLLDTEIDLNSKVARAKSTHFSLYSVSFPDLYADYFRKYRSASTNAPIYYVPYYFQSDMPWCAFYALSMITKYAGYNYKAPTYASLYNYSPSQFFSTHDLPTLDKFLEAKSIMTRIADPLWENVENLCGYILKQLNLGRPVWVGTESLNHVFVVVGHDNTSFYVNDPSGAFLAKSYPEIYKTSLAMVDVPYDKFIDALVNWKDLTKIGGLESTLVITSEGNSYSQYCSIDFPIPSGVEKMGYIEIADQNRNLIGELKIDGKYQPLGYSLINNTNKSNSFNGSDYFYIKPIVSNSYKDWFWVDLFYKLDNKEIKVVTLNLPPRWTNYDEIPIFEVQLKELPKGSHSLYVGLKSTTNPNLIYDSWEFPFIIDNEYFPSTTADNDGNTYNIITIGTQTWMKENLKTTTYSDRTPIPLETDNINWGKLTTPGYSWYDNDETTYKATYGALYNWYAVNTGKLCPTGWHVPSDAEWTTLEIYLQNNGYNYDGVADTDNNRETNNKTAKSLGALTHWKSSSEIGAIGNSDYPSARNKSGFTALPAGNHDTGGEFVALGTFGVWWSSTENSSGLPFYRLLFNMLPYVSSGASQKQDGFSVRCLKN